MLQIPVLNIVLEMYENAAKLYDEGFLPNFVEYVSQKSMKHGLCKALTEADSGLNFPGAYTYIGNLIDEVAEKLSIPPYKYPYIAVTPIDFDNKLANAARIKEGIDIRIKILKYMIENKIV